MRLSAVGSFCRAIRSSWSRSRFHSRCSRQRPSSFAARPRRRRSNSVGTDYFKAVGLPLLRGRAFTAAETMHDKSLTVAVIDEVLAKKLWPGGDALGQRIQFAGRDLPNPKTQNETGAQIEIVGIAAYARAGLFEKEPGGTLYLPFAG